MDTLTFVIAIISTAIVSGILVVLFGDQIIRKRSLEAAPDPMFDPQAIEKLREECELFKKDSFNASLEAQDLNKKLAAQQSAYNILSCEHQALKGQLADIEAMKQQIHKGDEVEITSLKKAKEEMEGQQNKSLEEYEKLKSEFESFKLESEQSRKSLEQKCEDFGFHKVAFEKLSEEHELMRRYLEDIQELHKGDQTTVEELKKKLDSTTEALRAEEQVQEDTFKLEALLEKQLAVQKKRAADLMELEKENKALKEQLEALKHEK